jgi:predicted phosphodiesterase
MSLKTCSRCQVAKSEDAFSTNGGSKRKSICKECRRKPITDRHGQETSLQEMLHIPDATLPLPPLRDRGNGWTPGVKMEYKESSVEGVVTTKPLQGVRDVTWDDILREWDLDPEEFQVVEPILVNKWDALAPGGVTVRMLQYKGRVIKRVPPATKGGGGVLDLERMINEFIPDNNVTKFRGDGVFVVSLADLQIGKGEGGGTEKTVQRFLHLVNLVEVRVKELRSLGRGIDDLVVTLPGDTVEGCSGDWYSMQTFQADLDNREQAKVARKLLTQALLRWAPMFRTVKVVAVAGNHGERRKNGKAYTTFSDNADLETVECVSEAFALSAKFDHVSFQLGNGSDPLNAVFNVAGWSYGLTHGHTALGGANPEIKLFNWFKGQAASKQPIGFVDVLVSGHFHHFRISDHGGLLFMQCPAVDGGSEWFTATSGEWSEPGLLTWAVYPDTRAGDIQVLSCPKELIGGPGKAL